MVTVIPYSFKKYLVLFYKEENWGMARSSGFPKGTQEFFLFFWPTRRWSPVLPGSPERGVWAGQGSLVTRSANGELVRLPQRGAVAGPLPVPSCREGRSGGCGGAGGCSSPAVARICVQAAPLSRSSLSELAICACDVSGALKDHLCFYHACITLSDDVRSWTWGQTSRELPSSGFTRLWATAAGLQARERGEPPVAGTNASLWAHTRGPCRAALYPSLLRAGRSVKETSSLTLIVSFPSGAPYSRRCAGSRRGQQ